MDLFIANGFSTVAMEGKQTIIDLIMNKVNEITKLNQMELENDVPFESSWHQTYKNCPWIYFGGLSSDLSEGDIICLFSQ